MTILATTTEDSVRSMHLTFVPLVLIAIRAKLHTPAVGTIDRGVVVDGCRMVIRWPRRLGRILILDKVVSAGSWRLRFVTRVGDNI
jgi:hypothetical protein